MSCLRDYSIGELRAILKTQYLAVYQAVGEAHLFCAECGKRTPILSAYRCRWCGFWFCPSCADKHFGPDATDWRLP
jgi:hypothetical protein